MSQGPLSYSWLSFPFYAPLSGSVTQDISTHLYQGVPEIEVAVITEVGSFGSQLGTLTKVVLELAEKIDARYPETRDRALETIEDAKGKKTPLEQLVVLDKLVDDIKERHRRAAEREARRALEQLRKFDEERYARFVKGLNP